MAPMTMRNPVTGAEEPYFPENKRFNRTLTGCMVIIIMVSLLKSSLPTQSNTHVHPIYGHGFHRCKMIIA